MRKKGFSLAEVSLAVGVSTILATLAGLSGQYVMKQSNMQGLVNSAKEVNAAADAYYQASISNGYTTGSDPWPHPASAIDLNTSLRRYLAKPTAVGTSLQYFSPVSGSNQDVAMTNWGGCAFPSPASDYPNNYANFNYPVGDRGKVIYFRDDNCFGAASDQPMKIWDGTKTQKFKMWSVQAIDDKGYPLVTLGR